MNMIVIVLSPGAAGSTMTIASMSPRTTDPSNGSADGVVSPSMTACSPASISMATIRDGSEFTSTAVTPTMTTMIPSSAPAMRRKRRRSSTEAIPAFRRGTA